MRKPSVVFFNRVYPPGRGATGRVLRDLARGFARDGWDVTVITTGPQSRKERDGAVRVLRIGISCRRHKGVSFYLKIWMRMLVAGLSMSRPDLIVTMTDPPLFVMAGRIIARMKKCRHMHWCQDLYPDLLPAIGVRVPPKAMQYFKINSRRAMKGCDKVVVIGRCMARHLTHSGMDAGRIAVIPNWPDAELMPDAVPYTVVNPPPANTQPVNGARPYNELFRDAEPKFRILYSGNIGRAHPVQTVLDAAGILLNRYPDIEFVFVGDGPAFDRLAQERAKRGLENIRFLPWQPASRLRDLMESGDVHLISMHNDAAGLLVPSKLYSALAVGRPCILVGPEQSETARIIQDFHAGSVVPQGQAEQLAQVIEAYRLSSEVWHGAHEGAVKAGRIFVPEESINAWLERARDIVRVRKIVRRRAAA